MRLIEQQIRQSLTFTEERTNLRALLTGSTPEESGLKAGIETFVIVQRQSEIHSSAASLDGVDHP